MAKQVRVPGNYVSSKGVGVHGCIQSPTSAVGTVVETRYDTPMAVSPSHFIGHRKGMKI